MSEERRGKIALALARRDGHQPEDIVDWQKTIYAQRADAFIEEHPDTDLCPGCGGTRFTYPEGGVIEIPCPLCSKPAEGVQPEPSPEGFVEIAEIEGFTTHVDGEGILHIKDEVKDDSISGTGQPDTDIGSDNPSEPKRTQKSKSTKKARKKSS